MYKTQRNTKKVYRQRHAEAKADRKSTRLNSSHGYISYAVFCLKKKKAKGKGKNTKTLVFESKYPSENQAIEARFALIHLANCSHKAPCDITINNNGAVFVKNPSWSVGEVTIC